MLNLLSKLVDTHQGQINKLQKQAEIISSLEKKYSKLTDKQLAEKTEQFKKSLQKDSSLLDEILPEAFAAVREAGQRTLKLRMYDVQFMASIVLHKGTIAEQKTGEGKTYSAVPAAYLNALTGEGVHIVTVNDYLAMRDCGWMGPLYHLLGISVATIVHEKAYLYDPKYKNTDHSDPRLKHLRPISRKEAYQADITYGTNNEFGFDYLRDNRVLSLEQMVQRGHNFAIVDEVDSILIDEARTPLIISQPSADPTKKYYEFSSIIDKLDATTDYAIDEKQKTSHLTEEGILKIEKILGVENLYEKDFSTLHHVEQALKARALFHKDRDYVVRDNEVIIVDEFTGRLMPGRRYSEGLHQAIEAKEGVTIQQESQTLATISFQNYFRMYKKLAGMTGTASTEAEEFHKIYKLDVVVLPTHHPMVRNDHPDVIYKTQEAKYNAVADEVELIHQTGQPVLVGTTSIEKNEYLSNLLKKRKVSHALLNAKNHEKEAEIISEAGEKGAVTIATNMAGRGVDIKLGKGVDTLGGLYVIGTERHESRRIDNQLRGRSGRQGDPGASKFFISLEDDLMRIFGGEQVAKVMNFLKIPEDAPIEHGMISKAIESAQKKVEGHNFDMRKTTLEYDDVMNQQRQVIYGIRKKILEAAVNKDSSGLKDDILAMIDKEIEQIILLHTQDGVNTQAIVEEFSTIINFDPHSRSELEKQIQAFGSTDEMTEFLIGVARNMYEGREKEVGPEIARQMEIFVYLNTIDMLWVEHLDTMDDLRVGIGLRSFGQREPLVEYKKEAFSLFNKLVQTIESEVVHRIYKVAVQGQPLVVSPQSAQLVEEHHPVIETGVATEAAELQAIAQRQPANQVIKQEGETKVTVERGGQVVSSQVYGSDGNLQRQKPGRNEPCWCGKTKSDGTPVKYKHCHYPN